MRRWRLRRRIDKRLLPAINSPVQCSIAEKTRVKFGSFMQKQREALLDERAEADQSDSRLKVISSILRTAHRASIFL